MLPYALVLALDEYPPDMTFKIAVQADLLYAGRACSEHYTDVAASSIRVHKIM